jgi:hypothetical protein
MPPGAPHAGGAPQPWDIGETFGLAWEGFKRCWGVLVGSYFLSAIIGGVPGQAPAILVATHTVDQGSTEYWTVYSICTVLGLMIQSFFQPGLIRIWLAVARGQAPEFGAMFGGGSKFLPVFATLLLTILAIMIGYVFLVVPGVIIGLGLMFSQFYVVDADMGPIEGMKASWQATNGHKGKLFLFSLVGGIVIFLGLLACCVGIYATLPIFWIALSIVYVRLSGRGTTSSGYDMGGGYGGYGGGYGGGVPPGYGAPPAGGYGAPPAGGGYGGPPPQGGGYGGPPPQGGGYGGPPQY